MSGNAKTAQLVVVGSSAGGIDALSRFARAIPPTFPAAIVIGQHLEPHRPSHLQDILKNAGPLQVETVGPHTPLRRGTIYVVPPGQNVAITNQDVSLVPAAGGPRPSIDMLFTSAARIFKDDLVAVVLTGTGSDGAAGAHEVKKEGGTVIIQDPATADFPALPLSLAPTIVDFSLTVEDMGDKINTLLTAPDGALVKNDDGLLKVLRHVEENSAIDFRQYKRPTIVRRLQRRMLATNRTTIEAYLEHLQSEPGEYRQLVDKFLIKVTEFFRDPDLFNELRARILPDIIEEARRKNREIRIWCAGCATGEEAYSVGILLADLLGGDLPEFQIRIFATDLDAASIEFARRGIYPTSALHDVPEEIVAKHFSFNGREYQIKKNIRALMLFGQHDLADRPPFPRIDLLVCRNVLIYFASELQRNVLRLFAFSLCNGGRLVLGKSETVSMLPNYFAADKSDQKIWIRRGEAARVPTSTLTRSLRGGHDKVVPRPIHRSPLTPVLGGGGRVERSQESDSRWLPILQLLPHGVAIVDRKYTIQHINLAGRKLLGIYGPAIGDDIVHVAQHVPDGRLRLALERAFRSGETIEVHEVSFAEPPDSATHYINVSCRPLDMEVNGQPPNTYVLIGVSDISAYQSRVLESGKEIEVLSSQYDLVSQQRQSLTDVISDMRKANEDLTAENLELRSANEEFLVGNEELQAATEEVETLNEELQASNEELETLNEELQATVEELNATNEDLNARGIELERVSTTADEASRAAQSERAKLEAVLSGMADAVVVVDDREHFVMSNDSFRAQFGEKTTSFVQTDPDGRRIPRDRLPEVRAARGEAFTLEFSTERGSDVVHYEVFGHPIHAPKFNGGVLVIRDTTDRSLRRTQEDFMAMASHELRTPLTVLRGYLALLQRGETDAVQATQFLELADKSARRIERLTYDLLEVVRLQSNHLSLNLQTVELNEVLAASVKTVEALYEDRRFEIHANARALAVVADPDRIEQVFVNVLLNAAKFTPPEGVIAVTHRKAGKKAVVAITDSGPGIDPRDLPQIFTRFFRGRKAPASGSAGLGLGLYISRELVIAQNGTIEAHSEPGAGATFTVRLSLSSD